MGLKGHAISELIASLAGHLSAACCPASQGSKQLVNNHNVKPLQEVTQLTWQQALEDFELSLLERDAEASW